MQQPKLLSKVWAALGLKNDIPDSRRTGIPNESATYEEGFPQITMTPIALGGKAPSGKDMNGILNELSAHTVYQNQGGIYKFDSAFAEKIGGYSKGSLLINNKLDKLFISLVDKNKTDFNSQDFSGKWEVVSGVNFFVPKTQKATLQETGIVKLYSGYDSEAEDLAATPKAIKILKAFIDALTRNFGNYIPNSKKSSRVDSSSADDVATSAAVKIAYDKGVEAKNAADNAQLTAEAANTNADTRVAKSGDTMTGSLTIAGASKNYKVGSYNWGKFIDLSGDAVIGNDKCVIGFNNNGVLHLGGKPNADEFNVSIDESTLWVRGDVKTKTGKSLNKSVSIDDFTTIKAGTGWTKLPTGLIIQWGQFLPSNLINNETGSTTFPQRYPHSVFCVICGSVGGSSGAGTEGFAVISQDNSKFEWKSYWESRHKRDFPEKIQWMAIGY